MTGPDQSSRPGRTRTAAVAALLAASVAAGCAQGGEIPKDDADAIQATLSKAQQAFDAGDCDTALPAAVAEAQAAVDALPDRVGNQVRDTLQDGLARLSSLGDTECEVAVTETQPPETLETEVPTETIETKPPKPPKPEKIKTQPEPDAETAETEATQPEEPLDEDFIPPGQGGTPPGQPGGGGSDEGDD